jgi:hypothetical protein
LNIPTRTPPSKRRHGPKSVLTPLQEVELWSWFCAKRELGTMKTQAKKMGVSPFVVEHAIKRMCARERMEARRIGRSNERFLREVGRLPF